MHENENMVESEAQIWGRECMKEEWSEKYALQRSVEQKIVLKNT